MAAGFDWADWIISFTAGVAGGGVFTFTVLAGRMIRQNKWFCMIAAMAIALHDADVAAEPFRVTERMREDLFNTIEEYRADVFRMRKREKEKG